MNSFEAIWLVSVAFFHFGFMILKLKLMPVTKKQLKIPLFYKKQCSPCQNLGTECLMSHM